MKYTKKLWNKEWFEYFILIHGKYRMGVRLLLTPSILLWSFIKCGLTIGTIGYDLFRTIKYYKILWI